MCSECNKVYSDCDGLKRNITQKVNRQTKLNAMEIEAKSSKSVDKLIELNAMVKIE